MGDAYYNPSSDSYGFTNGGSANYYDAKYSGLHDAYSFNTYFPSYDAYYSPYHDSYSFVQGGFLQLQDK